MNISNLNSTSGQQEQKSLKENYECSISRFFINVDYYTKNCFGLATINGINTIMLKHLVFPVISSYVNIQNNHYVNYIQNKDTLKSYILIFPFANFFVSLYEDYDLRQNMYRFIPKNTFLKLPAEQQLIRRIILDDILNIHKYDKYFLDEGFIEINSILFNNSQIVNKLWLIKNDISKDRCFFESLLTNIVKNKYLTFRYELDKIEKSINFTFKYLELSSSFKFDDCIVSRLTELSTSSNSNFFSDLDQFFALFKGKIDFDSYAFTNGVVPESLINIIKLMDKTPKDEHAKLADEIKKLYDRYLADCTSNECFGFPWERSVLLNDLLQLKNPLETLTIFNMGLLHEGFRSLHYNIKLEILKDIDSLSPNSKENLKLFFDQSENYKCFSKSQFKDDEFIYKYIIDVFRITDKISKDNLLKFFNLFETIEPYDIKEELINLLELENRVDTLDFCLSNNSFLKATSREKQHQFLKNVDRLHQFDLKDLDLRLNGLIFDFLSSSLIEDFPNESLQDYIDLIVDLITSKMVYFGANQSFDSPITKRQLNNPLFLYALAFRTGQYDKGYLIPHQEKLLKIADFFYDEKLISAFKNINAEDKSNEISSNPLEVNHSSNNNQNLILAFDRDLCNQFMSIHDLWTFSNINMEFKERFLSLYLKRFIAEMDLFMKNFNEEQKGRLAESVEKLRVRAKTYSDDINELENCNLIELNKEIKNILAISLRVLSMFSSKDEILIKKLSQLEIFSILSEISIQDIPESIMFLNLGYYLK